MLLNQIGIDNPPFFPRSISSVVTHSYSHFLGNAVPLEFPISLAVHLTASHLFEKVGKRRES